MGLEKPGGVPKAIRFRTLLHRAHLHDGARQLPADRADHGHRLYAGAAGRQRNAGALEPPGVPRLAADRLHAVPHLVQLPLDHYIRNLLAEAALQAAPRALRQHAGAGRRLLLEEPHRRPDDAPDRRPRHGAPHGLLRRAHADRLRRAVPDDDDHVPRGGLAVCAFDARRHADHLHPDEGVREARASAVRRPARAALPPEYGGAGEYLGQPRRQGVRARGLRDRALR